MRGTRDASSGSSRDRRNYHLAEQLPSEDPGADTQRRFRYQAAYAAIRALDLLRDDTGREELICEHFEDVLLKGTEGTFTGIQVKTRAAGRLPFKATDREMIDSLRRFIAHEQRCPDCFSSFVIATNCGFWHEGKTGSNLAHLLGLAAETKTPDTLRGPLGQFVQDLRQPGGKRGQAKFDEPTTESVLAVLRKTKLDEGPSLEDVEPRLVERIGESLGSANHPLASLQLAAEALINAMLRAAAQPGPESASVYFKPAPAGDPLQKKRFDRVKIQRVLQDALGRGRLVAGAAAAERRRGGAAGPLPTDAAGTGAGRGRLAASRVRAGAGVFFPLPRGEPRLAARWQFGLGCGAHSGVERRPLQPRAVFAHGRPGRGPRKETPQDYLEQVFADSGETGLRNGFVVLGRIALWDESHGATWLTRLLATDVPGRARAAFDAALTLGGHTALAPLGQVLAESLSRDGTPDLAAELEPLLPWETVSLREVGLWAVRMLLDRSPPTPDDEAAIRERSRLLHNAGKRLSDLGRREEALQATAEAVRLTLPLAERYPQVFLDDLRSRLQNLRERYAESEQDPDADPLVRQATELLARLEPGPYLSPVLSCSASSSASISSWSEPLGQLQGTVFFQPRFWNVCSSQPARMRAHWRWITCGGGL